MVELFNEYMSRPKLISIYRHVGAYRKLQVDGTDFYHILFSGAGIEDFREVLLSESEVACFVDIDRESLLSDLRKKFSGYQIESFRYPIGVMETIDCFLTTLGDGYNSSWSPVEVNGCQLGWVNHDLQVVAVMVDADIALRQAPMLEVEHGGFTYQGLCEGYVFSRVGPVRLGAGRKDVNTYDEARSLSVRVLDYFNEVDGKYEREHNFWRMSDSKFIDS